jgi:hypothetical protein
LENMKLSKLFVVLAVLALMIGVPAKAQVVSNVQTVSLSMLVGESITLGPPSVPSVTYTYNPLQGTGTPSPATFTIPLSWSLTPSHTGVKIVSWVANNGAPGLSAPGGLSIPAADFFESSSDSAGNFNNSLGPCSSSVSAPGIAGFVNGGGCSVMSLSLSQTGNQFSDVITVGTALQGLSSNLAPGGYSATLFFMAVTF